jgi:HlyD family secretion protein
MGSEQPPDVDLSRLRINREPASETPSRPPFYRRPSSIIAGVLLIFSALAAVRWMSSGAEDVEVASATRVFPSQVNAVLTASGYVVAQEKAAVASKGTGRLVYLGVEEGDHVTKGEVIARLDDQDVMAALEKARADLHVALADSVDAARTLNRAKALFASKLASESDFDAAEANYLKLVANILSARAGVSSAEVGVEYTRIRAPFDGTVLTKDADVGEIVAPFAAAANSRASVVSIANMASLQVEADVSESNITRVTEGQPCEIVLDAYPDHRYQAVVHKVVPTADRAKATVLTKVAFRNLDNRVLPEMSAKVTFLSNKTDSLTAAAPPMITVPSTAIVVRGGKSVVFLVADSRVTETAVRTGASLGATVEIVEGLSSGDHVVLVPGPGLASGTKINIKTH